MVIEPVRGTIIRHFSPVNYNCGPTGRRFANAGILRVRVAVVRHVDDSLYHFAEALRSAWAAAKTGFAECPDA